MTDMTKTTGFVIVDNTAIWGAGETEEQAWDDSRQWIDIKADEEDWSDGEGYDGDPYPENNWQKGFDAYPATAALADYVAKHGTPNSWGYITDPELGLVACTSEEDIDT